MSDLPFELPPGMSLGADVPLEDFEADASYPSQFEGPETAVQTLDSSFDPQVHNDVVGMVFLGALTQEFDVFGHRIVLSTLTAGEELSIALVIKDYQETLAQGKAFATATVAAAIETVDGQQPWPQPLGPSQTFGIREKFGWVKENWHWATVEAIYSVYAELLLRQEVAFEELDSKS